MGKVIPLGAVVVCLAGCGDGLMKPELRGEAKALGLDDGSVSPKEPGPPSHDDGRVRPRDPRVVAMAERTGSAVPARAAELRDCVERQTTPGRTVSGAELRRLADEIRRNCLGVTENGRRPQTEEDKRRVYESRFAMPLAVGVHEVTGVPVELRYFCGDVCPDYGWVQFSLVGFNPAQCCSLGATPAFSHANNYVACVPPELSTSQEHQDECTRVRSAK